MLQTTQAQEPLEDLFSDLDLLLQEGQAALAAKKGLKTNTHFAGFGEQYQAWKIGDRWVTKFNAAIFIEQVCDCGHRHRAFSHFAAWQVFSKQSAGKPSCWKKLDQRPETLSNPRIIQQAVPICQECYGGKEALPLWAEQPESKLLWEIKS